MNHPGERDSAGAGARPATGAFRAGPIVWVGLAVSLFFLWMFLRNVHWGELSESLAQANYLYVLPALALWFATIWIRSLRWQVMVRHLKPVPLSSLASSVLIGFMATGLLPARAGELVRAVVLARKEKLSGTGVFATIVVERIFDLLAVLFFMAVVLLYLPASGEHRETLENLRYFGALFAGVIVAAVAFLAALRIWPHRMKQLLDPALALLPGGLGAKVHTLLDNFVEGLGMLSGWTELATVSLLSLLLWLVIGLINWVLSFAFGIHIGILGGCLIFVVTAFAIAVPQAPSFIGVFHVAVETSLSLLGVTTMLAKSYAILLWALSLLPPIFIGLFLAWHEGLTLAELSRGSERIAPGDSTPVDGAVSG